MNCAKEKVSFSNRLSILKSFGICPTVLWLSPRRGDTEGHHCKMGPFWIQPFFLVWFECVRWHISSLAEAQLALLENPNIFLCIHANVCRHRAEKLFSFKITLAVLVLSCPWACLPCSDFVSCPRLCRRRYCHKLFPDICRSVLEVPSAVHSGEKLLCSQVVTEGRKSAKPFFFPCCRIISCRKRSFCLP